MSKLHSVKTMGEVKAENTHNDNTFGLVYQGALTENKPGAVNIHPISYDLNGLKIAANVYTPADYDPDQTYAAVIVAHPNGGVKEQVAGLFAQKLAENGYITMAMDAAYQGGSEGEPRNTDKPANRVEDIHRAADIIATVPGVDGDRIGILGICGGGGYTIKAVQTDKRFKAVATLSMFNSGVVRRNDFLDGQTATIQERLAEASKARQQEAEGGEVLYTPDMCDMPEEEAEKLPLRPVPRWLLLLRQEPPSPQVDFPLHGVELPRPHELRRGRQRRPHQPTLAHDGRQRCRHLLHDGARLRSMHRHAEQGALPDSRRAPHRDLPEAGVRPAGGREGRRVLREEPVGKG